MRKRTACDVLAEANRIYSRPSTLTREELEGLVDDLYNMIYEMHGMAESMEQRLHDYNDFVQQIKTDATSLLDS